MTTTNQGCAEVSSDRKAEKTIPDKEEATVAPEASQDAKPLAPKSEVQETNVTLSLPDWAVKDIDSLPSLIFETIEDRMDLVLQFARKNFELRTGGPFAAAVFMSETGKMISMGVNRVIATDCSTAHAEVMALSLAQQTIGTFDLDEKNFPRLQLVVNWRPCAMCYGAVIWSRVSEVVIAGDGDEVEKYAGFDEGPIHPEWEKELEKRGISLIKNIKRDEAVQIFKDYQKSNPQPY
jgi:tRNA(Arg) A34 adenosine deaminase TadA